MLKVLFAAATVAALPVSAAAASYSATLIKPTSERFIARDIVWNCGPAACQGTTDQSRPLVLCQSLAKRAGAVSVFTFDGRALAPAELDRCNSAAKAAPAQALAAQ